MALAACSSAANSSPSVGSATNSPAVAVHSLYQPTLGTSIPVPAGWVVGKELDTGGVSMDPAGPLSHGPRGPSISFEKLAKPPSLVLRDACQPNDKYNHNYAGDDAGRQAATSVHGPMDIDGHANSYGYRCPAAFPSDWKLLIPANGGSQTWRLTFVGLGRPYFFGDGDGGRDPFGNSPLLYTVLTAFRAI